MILYKILTSWLSPHLNVQINSDQQEKSSTGNNKDIVQYSLWSYSYCMEAAYHHYKQTDADNLKNWEPVSKEWAS